MPPIKPNEVVAKKFDGIPDQVFEAFNELIAKNWTGHSSRVLQEDVLNLITAKMTGTSLDGQEIDRQVVFNNHWLDVEDSYRREGWDVDFDKPCQGESFPARFIFKKKS
jgi:hypothetical protein